MEPSRILLVDDHVLLRKGIAALLATREDMVVVGEAGNGLEAIALARKTAPDIILMDLLMPECGGLEAIKVLKQEMPHVHIVILTVSEDDRHLFASIKSGASGYLLKTLEPGELFSMLEGLRRGEAAISRVLASKILQEFRQPTEDALPETQTKVTLSPREREILQQVVEGATNREIARTLCISEHTVKIHIQNILEKLHLKNRIQVAVYAVQEGLVDKPSWGS